MRRAPGHNRDMMVVTAESGGETFCFLSDLVPLAAHLQPTWIPPSIFTRYSRLSPDATGARAPPSSTSSPACGTSRFTRERSR